jgi:hypothetical protein
MSDVLKLKKMIEVSPGHITVNISPKSDISENSEYPEIRTVEMKKMADSLCKEINQTRRDKNIKRESDINTFSPSHENDTEVNTRTKFKTVHERDIVNTDAEINTDETIYNTPEEDSMQAGVTVFSVTSLNRKLKQSQKCSEKSESQKCSEKSESQKCSEKSKSQKCSEKSKSHKWSITKPPNRRASNVSVLGESSRVLLQNRMNPVIIMMNPSKLINEHLSEIQLRIVGHTRAAISYEKKDKIIGYPVTILSSFITSATMMSIMEDKSNDSNIIKYISLSLSIASFLFSVSRDYLNFAKKHQSHDLSAKLYTTLLRSVEVRLIKNHLGKEDKRDIFKDIVDQMSIIEQYETPIPSGIDNKVRGENQSLAQSHHV